MVILLPSFDAGRPWSAKSSTPENLTTLLMRMRQGDRAVEEQVVFLIYATLHKLAAACGGREWITARRAHIPVNAVFPGG